MMNSFKCEINGALVNHLEEEQLYPNGEKSGVNSVSEDDDNDLRNH